MLLLVQILGPDYVMYIPILDKPNLALARPGGKYLCPASTAAVQVFWDEIALAITALDTYFMKTCNWYLRPYLGYGHTRSWTKSLERRTNCRFENGVGSRGSD